MRRRKGQAKSRMVETILIIIVFSLILIASPKLFGWVKGESKDQICRFTVGSKLFTKVGSFSFIREKCPAYNIIIYDDKFVKDGNPLTFKTNFIDKNGKEKAKIFSNFNELDGIKSIDKEAVYEEKLYYLLAEEMLDCWDKFGRGAEIFDSDFWKNSKQCARCAHVLFDSSASTKGPYHNFDNFLNSNNPKDSEKTYDYELRMDVIDYAGDINTLLTGDEPLNTKYYHPDNYVVNSTYVINPSIKNNLDIIYYMHHDEKRAYIRKALTLSSMDVPSHIFLVKPEQVSIYLCENFMN
jgi:hypothetical protein